jgi:hypothetical protein
MSDPLRFGSRLAHTRCVLEEVRDERHRQELLREQGHHAFTCADTNIADADKLPVLAEEFGEVAIELCSGQHAQASGIAYRIDRQKLRTELIQTTAVAVAWAESLTEDAR